EGEDEGDEVQRERQHPQEGHARDVLRDVVGHREQHYRAHRRQQQPPDLVAGRDRLRVGGGRRYLPRIESIHREPRGDAAEQREPGEQERPCPAERRQVEHRLEQHREAEQREQRSEVGKREQPIGHHALEAPPVPRLQQRRGGRQQEVRQADGRAEQQQDAQDRLLVALRLPAGGGEDRQAGERNHEQRHVQHRLAPRAEPGRQVGVSVAGEKNALEEQQERRKENRRRVRQRSGQREARYFSTDFRVLPISAGLRVTLMPHSSITA